MKKNYKDNKKKKTNILACNDNHIVHNFITICSFFFSLQKDYLVVLGRSRWVDEAEVSPCGRCGEVGCSVSRYLPLNNSPHVSQVLYGDNYTKSLLAAGLDSGFVFSVRSLVGLGRVFGPLLEGNCTPPVDFSFGDKMLHLRLSPAAFSLVSHRLRLP